MPKLPPFVWIIAIIGVLGLLLLPSINTIPKLEQEVQAAWAQVENNYQRRMDLVPNLVETVKGAANFEQKTLTDVINARASATKVTINAGQLTDPAAVKQFEAAQGELSSALSRLMVTVEKYPDLKATQNFQALQSQLEGTENRIAVARRDYILVVQHYNTEVTTFPGRIWAWFYGAQVKATFSAAPGADKPPAVKF